MRMLMLAGAAAMFAVAAPAAAQPGHGKGHGNHASNHSTMKSQHSAKGRYGAWGNSCPPGLAKKNNGCMPPGQARKHYREGQRWNSNYGQRWSWSQVPYDWRNRYDLNSNDRYYYRDGYLYSVDPRTMLVEQIIRAVL